MLNLSNEIKKYIKESDVYISIDKVIGSHKSAEINPMMSNEELEALKLDLENNGQINNLLLMEVYPRGAKEPSYLIVDGRNRFECFKQLNKELGSFNEFKCDIVKSITPKKLLDNYIKSIHKRRNLTSDQKTIMALREYLELKNKGEKVRQENVAKKYGLTKPTLSKCLKVYEKLGNEPLDRFFNLKTYSPFGSDKVYKTINQLYKDIVKNKKEIDKETIDNIIAEAIEQGKLSKSDLLDDVINTIKKQSEMIKDKNINFKKLYFEVLKLPKIIKNAFLTDIETSNIIQSHIINELNN